MNLDITHLEITVTGEQLKQLGTSCPARGYSSCLSSVLMLKLVQKQDMAETKKKKIES